MTETSTPAGAQRTRRVSVIDVALGAAFLALTALVWLADTPPAVDVRVLDALPPRAGSGSIRVLSLSARSLTDLGQPTVGALATITLAVVLALVWRSRAPLRFVALPVVVEAVIVLTLKAAVDRPGPIHQAHHRTFGYFPSGHTATALVCTGALATLVALWRPEWSRWLRLVVVGWALLMGASLVYYRYHWLSDVLASLLLGLLILRLLCRPLWAPTRAAVPSADDPAAEDDPLRLREDA